MSHRGIDPLAVGEHDPSPMRTTLLRAGLTVLAVLVLVGVLVGVSVLLRDTTTQTAEVELGDVPQVALRVPTADVTVVAGDVDVLQVEARVTSGLLDTDYELRRRGSEVEVLAGCQAWLNPGCGVAVTVTVPREVPVVLTGGSGDVVLDGLSGVVGVSTTSGDVRGDALVIGDLTVSARSGDVRAAFAEDPRAVKVGTASGDVALTLPAEVPYLVDAASTSGGVDVGIDTADDQVQRFVRVRSDSGDVSVSR